MIDKRSWVSLQKHKRMRLRLCCCLCLCFCSAPRAAPSILVQTTLIGDCDSVRSGFRLGFRIGFRLGFRLRTHDPGPNDFTDFQQILRIQITPIDDSRCFSRICVRHQQRCHVIDFRWKAPQAAWRGIAIIECRCGHCERHIAKLNCRGCTLWHDDER